DLSATNLTSLASAHRLLEGRLGGAGFLFAIAVKRTTRSDRLYQALFEANALKYYIENVLKGGSFRFYAHMGSLEGADVQGRYRAATLISLIRGGAPQRAIDVTYTSERP